MVNIKLSDRELPILFTLNVIEKVQNRYGNIEDLSSKIKEIKESKWIITELVNEAIEYNNFISNKNDPIYTENQIGMLIGAKAISSEGLGNTIIAAFNESLGDEKKITAEQVMSMSSMMMK